MAVPNPFELHGHASNIIYGLSGSCQLVHSGQDLNQTEKPFAGEKGENTRIEYSLMVTRTS